MKKNWRIGAITLIGIIALGIGMMVIYWNVHQAVAASSDGYLVVDHGVVYFVSGSQRQVSAATAGDLALAVGPVMIFRDGTLVKGPDSALVYLVANGQKRGFVSAEAFWGLGYSFSNVVTANTETFADLPTGDPIVSSAMAHPAGTLVNTNGTVSLITAAGRQGFSSADVFYSYGYDFKKVVSGNSFDSALPSAGLMLARVSSKTAAAAPNQTVLPAVTSVSPAQVSVGDQVTIIGTGFSSGSNTVQLGTVIAGSSLPSNGTAIVFTVPESACGANLNCYLAVYVITTNGASQQAKYLDVKGKVAAVKILPVISSIIPTSGKAGDLITLRGTASPRGVPRGWIIISPQSRPQQFRK